MRMADGTEIEERIDLMNKLKRVVLKREGEKFLTDIKMLMNNKIDKTPTLIIKGFLFAYYGNISDKQVYEKLNEELKVFMAKVS